VAGSTSWMEERNLAQRHRTPVSVAAAAAPPLFAPSAWSPDHPPGLPGLRSPAETVRRMWLSRPPAGRQGTEIRSPAVGETEEVNGDKSEAVRGKSFLLRARRRRAW
jgi:hypothetical protein